MNKKTKYILVLSTILAFAVGAWPIGIGIIIFGIYLSTSAKKESQETKINQLEKRIEELENKKEKL